MSNIETQVLPAPSLWIWRNNKNVGPLQILVWSFKIATKKREKEECAYILKKMSMVINI